MMEIFSPAEIEVQPTSDGGIALLVHPTSGTPTVLSLTPSQTERMIIDLLLAARIAAECNPAAPSGKTMSRGAMPIPENATSADELGFALTSDHQAVTLTFRFGAAVVPILLPVAALETTIGDLSQIALALRSGSSRTQ
jgi:hypothetical protein